jgi:hypothetical protein
MSERIPPKFALWLLKAWGPAYHSESLAGDLIEQYQQGRSRAWCWGQVAAAIAFARASAIRRLSARSGMRKLTRQAIRKLLLAFGVIALGAGTLTWAATTHRDACRNATCICP